MDKLNVLLILSIMILISLFTYTLGYTHGFTNGINSYKDNYDQQLSITGDCLYEYGKLSNKYNEMLLDKTKSKLLELEDN